MSTNTLVQVTKEGDSLFGKIFRVLRADAEHVVAEIETEAGKLEALFHRSSVSEKAGNHPDPAPVTKASTQEVEASDVALQTAEPNEVQAPAIPLPAVSNPPAEGAAAGAPETPAPNTASTDKPVDNPPAA